MQLVPLWSLQDQVSFSFFFFLHASKNSNASHNSTLVLGYLTARHSQEISVSYTPSEARVQIATALFKFSEGEDFVKTLKMSAIGKYAFLIIN